MLAVLLCMYLNFVCSYVAIFIDKYFTNITGPRDIKLIQLYIAVISQPTH